MRRASLSSHSSRAAWFWLGSVVAAWLGDYGHGWDGASVSHPKGLDVGGEVFCESEDGDNYAWQRRRWRAIYRLHGRRGATLLRKRLQLILRGNRRRMRGGGAGADVSRRRGENKLAKVHCWQALRVCSEPP